MTLPTQSAASRLCAACGICCTGVMFHNVRIQSNDAWRELVAFGLKLKRKHSEQFTQQPCPAYRESQCAIYPQRPVRCQLFTCRQLQRVAVGKVSESEALEKINEVVDRVALVEELLHASGKTDPQKPLAKRYEKITAEPVDLSGDPHAVELRGQLLHAMQALEELLAKDFRPSS